MTSTGIYSRRSIWRKWPVCGVLLPFLCAAIAASTPAVSGTTCTRSGGILRIDSEEMTAKIDSSTGMLSGLVSKSLAPLSVMPDGKQMSVYIRTGSSTSDLIRIDKCIHTSKLVKDNGFSVRCVPSDPKWAGLAKATVLYVIKKGALSVRVETTLRESLPGVPEIGMGQGYDPKQWESQWYCSLYLNKEFRFDNPEEAMKPRLLQYDQSDDDDIYSTHLGWDDWLQMPLGVLERSDRYMLWGSLDLGRFSVLAPNNERLLPSFIYRPKVGVKGKTFVFDTFIKFISKRDTDFTEAYRWYAQNVYSTNPITKGIVTMPKDYKAHTVSYGNIGCINTYMSEWGVDGSKNSAWKTWEDTQVEGDFIHQWFGELQTFDGRIPTEGKWWAPYTNRELSAEQLKAWIDRLHSRGLKVYLYNRQLFGNHRMYDGNPPFKEWMKKDRAGNYMPYGCGNLTNYDGVWYDLSDADAQRFGVDKAKLKELFGSDKVGWLYADFDNADFRKWYVERVKAQIEYFNADGVSWDMAWFDVHRGIHHGLLRVQYEIYQWLKQKHPEKRVLCNMGQGNPSSLYTDMIYMEGPPWSVQIRAVQAGHAYLVPMNVPLEYDDWKLVISEGMKCPSLGLTCFSQHVAGNRLKNVPRLIKEMKWLFEFSARANTLPTLSYFGLIRCEPDDAKITASAWGGPNGLMIAARRDESSTTGPVEVRISLDAQILARNQVVTNGVWKFTVISPDGKPKSSNDFKCVNGADGLYLVGSLSPGELVLGELNSK